jgi:hypothetical protein
LIPRLLARGHELRALARPGSEGDCLRRARRLGLVTLEQLLSALTFAVENPVEGKRILEVSEIRNTIL